MSTIKGLTVVIDGNVTPLSKKMAELKAEATTLGAHFRSMSNLLAINPTNTALWARQQGIINAGLAIGAQESRIECGLCHTSVFGQRT